MEDTVTPRHPPAKVLWIANPWRALDHPVDTTARLLHESVLHSNRNYWGDPSHIYWDGDNAYVKCRAILSVDGGHPIGGSIVFGRLERMDAGSFDSILLRVDPPISARYADAVRLLAAAIRHHGRDPEACIINPPSVLLNQSAKLLTLFAGDIPGTIVSNNAEQLAEFVTKKRTVVLKPLHRHGGKGVRLLDSRIGRMRVKAVLSAATENGLAYVLAQRYLENYRETEKRVWFLDGNVLAACGKRFHGHSFPPKFAKNKYILPTQLTQTERNVCRHLGATLRRLNARMAGVDLIDGLVTDINVVSPGLLVEMELATGSNLAAKVLALIESCRR